MVATIKRRFKKRKISVCLNRSKTAPLRGYYSSFPATFCIFYKENFVKNVITVIVSNNEDYSAFVDKTGHSC